MAQSIVFEFSSDATLYNAISLANKLVGDYDIKIQYNGGDASGLIPRASLDTNDNLSLSADEIDAFINDPLKQLNGAIRIKPIFLNDTPGGFGRLIQDEDSTITGIFDNSTIANTAVGLAPAIKKSMTIDFLSSTGKVHEVALGSQIEVISDVGPRTNPEPFTQQGRELVVIFRINFASGFKIDDGNPGNKINVEINNLTPTYSGANFFNLQRSFPAQPLNYAEHGALIENNENLKLNNLTLDTFWAIGRNQREVRAAPILNKPGGDLTITGEVVSGQAFQYTNSFAYNQGRLHFDNANVNFYDISKVASVQFSNTFGGMARAKGAIANALGAQLTATNSRFSQESADRSGEYTDARQLSFNRGENAQIKTDVPFEAPSSLQYLIDNYGTLDFQDSELSGIINTEGDASFIRSRLGLSKSNDLAGNNVNIRGGVFSLDQSIVDNVKINASSAFGFNKKNSVVLKGKGSGDLSNSVLSLLDPNQPSLFSDATRQGYTPVGLITTQINPLAYQTYDPNKLNPAVLSAITSILNGTGTGGGSGSGSGGSSGGSSGSGGSGTGTSGSGGTTGNQASGSGGTELDNDNLDESPENHNGLVIDANKDGIPDATQSNVAGIKRVGDGTSQGDFAALAVGSNYTLNAVTILPIANGKVTVSLPAGGSVTTEIPSGVTALLNPLEFYVEGVAPGATIEAELFIPDNFRQQTDAYMRFNYLTRRFEEYVDVNGAKLYTLLDEDADGKVDRVLFSLTDGDPRWDGDGQANGVIIDPGSPIDAPIDFKGGKKADRITGNLLANTIRGKAGKDHLDGGLGRDVIKGGRAKDFITGGEHGDLLNGGHSRDHFIYHSAADSSSTNPFQRDVIARFKKNDRIDLRKFDASVIEDGIQDFQFISGNVFTGSAGQLRFAFGLLEADLDGDRIADFTVEVDGRVSANQLLL